MTRRVVVFLVVEAVGLAIIGGVTAALQPGTIGAALIGMFAGWAVFWAAWTAQDHAR